MGDTTNCIVRKELESREGAARNIFPVSEETVLAGETMQEAADRMNAASGKSEFVKFVVCRGTYEEVYDKWIGSRAV